MSKVKLLSKCIIDFLYELRKLKIFAIAITKASLRKDQLNT